MRVLIFSAVLLFLIVSTVSASPAILTPEMDQLRQEGFNSLLNMNYDQAKERFEQMIQQSPDHPAGYVYVANAVWQNHLLTLRRLQTRIYNKTDAFFRESKEEVDPHVDKEFYERINRAIALTENNLEKNPNDIASLYYLGIARNLIAGYDATVKRAFFSALRNSSKGVGLHQRIMKLDPEFVDAKLSVGIYEYVIGSLPFFVKMLVFFGGVHGSKKEGLKLIREVSVKGNYSLDEASIMLVMFYSREKRLAESLAILETLTKKYPQNFLFRLEEGNTLSDLKQYNKSFQAFEELLKDPAAADYMPDLLHYQYAEVLFDAQHWQEAYSQYTEAAESPKAPESLITMAYLGAGKSLDGMKRRNEATSKYQLVLRRKESLDSHDQAKKYLKKPYAS